MRPETFVYIQRKNREKKRERGGGKFKVRGRKEKKSHEDGKWGKYMREVFSIHSQSPVNQQSP